jgi:phosphatidylserine/phosphatidylglycerophosphate/cardiolipin synthase-like enzyme
MTLRRGVPLVLAFAALLAYGFAHSHSFSALSPVVATSTASDANDHYIITEPDAGIAPLVAMIADATTSVDLVMYELEDTDVEHALAADETRGIKVRVLLNGGYYGKKESTDNDAAYQYFTANDVAVHWTPSYFALTHQKTLVIDGKSAVIMTMNMTPQYYASSREFNIVDNDQNDVSAIKAAFDTDWDGDNTVAGNGDDLVWSPGSEPALLSLINNAQTSLDIYNEEMDDASITSALADAAKRGVAVRVDMTYSSEWKSAFTTLTGAGAQVRTYAANAPLYIHAKVIVADGTQAFVGSENFSSGSLSKNRELGIIVADPVTISSIESTFDKDWAGASDFQK